jgi:hypothetical protein
LGFLFLAGLYVCSISSTLGEFYAPSRLIYTIAKQDLLPKKLDFLKISVIFFLKIITLAKIN